MRTKFTSPGFTKAKPTWKIDNAQSKPKAAWGVTADKAGKQTFRELNPPTFSPSHHPNEHSRSQFEIEITDGCCVAGHAAEPGDLVICYVITASLLRERGRIVRERQNFF